MIRTDECVMHSGHEARLSDVENEVDLIRNRLDKIMILLISIGIEIPALGLII